MILKVKLNWIFVFGCINWGQYEDFYMSKHLPILAEHNWMWTFLSFLFRSVVFAAEVRKFEWIVDNFGHDNLTECVMLWRFLFPKLIEHIFFKWNCCPKNKYKISYRIFTSLWNFTQIYKIHGDCCNIADNFCRFFSPTK